MCKAVVVYFINSNNGVWSVDVSKMAEQAAPRSHLLQKH